MSKNGEIYTTGKNFTLPPGLTGWTNSTSVQTTKSTLRTMIFRFGFYKQAFKHSPESNHQYPFSSRNSPEVDKFFEVQVRRLPETIARQAAMTITALIMMPTENYCRMWQSTKSYKGSLSQMLPSELFEDMLCN